MLGKIRFQDLSRTLKDLINNKADKSNVYTKKEINDKIFGGASAFTLKKMTINIEITEEDAFSYDLSTKGIPETNMIFILTLNNTIINEFMCKNNILTITTEDAPKIGDDMQLMVIYIE